MRLTDYDKLQLKLRDYADKKAANGEIELANGILKAKCFIDQECEIINEKQLNGAWIPVENALPDENENVIITIKEIANEVGGYRYYTSTAWLQEGQWIFRRNQYNPVVIAWQNFPKAYKEGLDE